MDLKLRDGLLRGEEAEALLACDALLGELVVRAEASRVRRKRRRPVWRGFLLRESRSRFGRETRAGQKSERAASVAQRLALACGE